MRTPSLAVIKLAPGPSSAIRLHALAERPRHVVELLLERRLDGELRHEALGLALDVDADPQLRAARVERHAAGALLPDPPVADLGEGDAPVVLAVEMEGGLAVLAEQSVVRSRGPALPRARNDLGGRVGKEARERGVLREHRLRALPRGCDVELLRQLHLSDLDPARRDQERRPGRELAQRP